jgi:hypothetical protein
MSSDLQQLAELIDRLNSTGVQTMDEARNKQQSYNPSILDRMLNEGVTYGEASGWLPWFQGDNPVANLHAVNNDLSAQISMVNHILDFWFERGEPVPSHYPERIAIILRKAKRGDLEVDFLRSFARHFLSHCGGVGHAKFNDRIRKLLGGEESSRLERISQMGGQ